MKRPFKLLPLSLAFFILTSCGNLEKEMKPVREEQLANQTVTTGRIDRTIYQSMLEDGTYQKNPVHGLTASGLQSGYNQKNFEKGLLRFAHEQFSADEYYFREGQVVDEVTMKSWLGRESEDNPQGLNAEDEQTPLIFQQFLAYELMEEDGQTLAGVSLGFAFTRHFEQEGSKQEISREAMMKQVHKTVNSSLTRIRKQPGYERLPIQVNIYEQAPANQLLGGKYIYTAVSQKGEQSIAEYEEVREVTLLLPVSENVQNLATEKGINQPFLTFKSAIQTAFPDLVGVTGQALFVDEQLIDFTIKIDSKYFSQSEIASYTQYVGKQVEVLFKGLGADVSVEIHALGMPQSLILLKEDTVTSHLFN
ncbi:CamS family sex pheromone protein [Enterococcus sp. LJL98]